MTTAEGPARLLWIVDREALANGSIPRALRGGVRWLHLREPDIQASTWRGHLRDGCPSGHLVAVVVNGAPPWAREARWGAHLKACQPTLAVAERRAWPLLGRSVHDKVELQQALKDQPDYLVAGPVFATSSKPGHPGIGLAGLASICADAAPCPVLAIGGIGPAEIPRLLGRGAHGVAVRSGITAAGDPEAATRAYLEALPDDPR
jgi:thiamine-phosphate diphosphorylase